MKNKKLSIVLLGLVLMLAVVACGNKDEDKKSSNNKTKKPVQSQVINEEKEVHDNVTEESSVADTTEKESSSNQSESSAEEVSTGKLKNDLNNESNSNTDSSNSSSNTQESSSGTAEKPSSGSDTTQPSTGSNNTGGSTTTKKPVERVSEEVKSAVVPYKYGITKYDITTNNYTLYSDGSKELLDSWSYTVYDSTNYSATDSQLKSEADSNASKCMSYYQEVLRLVNEIRAEVGVAPLTLDTTLCQAASMRALEMDYGDEMSHTRPNGSTCWTVLDFYGASYGTCGENIAAGQASAASAVKDWKNSSGHYQNMINASFTKLGVGYSAMGIGDYGHYWCQLFLN